MFVITLFLCLCGILYVLIAWCIDGLLCRSARCFHLKMSSEVLSKLCRHKLICVTSCFMSFVAQPRVLCSFHLGRHVQMVSLILKGVTNVLCVSPLQVDLPETDAMSCLNVCMFHRHSCCHKHLVCSV